MKQEDKIYIAGHTGMVGSNILRQLKEEGFLNLLTRTSKELDLRDQAATFAFFEEERPDYVFLCAAKVGGILANSTEGASFLYDNLMISANVIHAAYLTKVQKLLNLGSSCIYPKFADQPIQEKALLSGLLEPTNEPYAIAKIAALKLCENYRNNYECDFISLMPTNLYGHNDSYDLQKSHVLPALIRKFHEAKIGGKSQVEVWGTGTPLREFLHVDDLAKACLLLMQKNIEEDYLNVGSGEEVSIVGLAQMIQKIVGFQGGIVFDPSKPDGTPRKKLDSSLLEKYGWKPSISLADGITSLYSKLQKEWSK